MTGTLEDTRPQDTAPSNEPCGSLQLATCWVLGTLLTKQDVQPWGMHSTTRQIVGYQLAASEAEAIGQFVVRTQERNPGFAVGEIISLKLPYSVGKAPNTAGEPMPGTSHRKQ